MYIIYQNVQKINTHRSALLKIYFEYYISHISMIGMLDSDVTLWGRLGVDPLLCGGARR